MKIPHPPVQSVQIGHSIAMIQRVARMPSDQMGKDAKLRKMLDNYKQAVAELASYHQHYALAVIQSAE